MRISRIFLVSFLCLLPLSGFAQSGLLDSQTTLSELSLLIAQYDARIKKLEAENAVLRYEMARANISIPLMDLSGSTTPIPTTLPNPPPVIGTADIVVTSTTLSGITSQYGRDVSGFISRINKEWSGIKSTYSLPTGARLA
jgi:hypothetical protein